MVNLFFPGDFHSILRPSSERCLWREENFMLHLVRIAVNPLLQMKDCVENWPRIAARLREPSRKRRRQMDNKWR